MARAVTVRLTGGALLSLALLTAFSALLLAFLPAGESLRDRILGRKSAQTVSATVMGIEERALLDCAVFRIRAVYPYDFPEEASLTRFERDESRFIILTARITAGYDLASLPPPEGDGSRLVWELGKPEITSLTVDDGVRAGEGLPDIRITPEEWGLIVRKITPSLGRMAADRGIMEEAERFGREYLTRLFKGAGYDQICFTE